MRKDRQLTLSDVESVYELVNECREQWADARAWQAHLLRGACRLTGTVVGMYNELRISPDGSTIHILDRLDLGWRDDQARSHYLRMTTDHPDFATFMPRCTQLAGVARQGQSVAALRRELRGDREWRMSVMFNDYWRPAGLNESILAFSASPRTGNAIMLTLNQAIAAPAPTWREKMILELLGRKIAPLVGTRLTTRSQRGLHQLSPRLRQTLDGLLDGAAEKQIAAQLGISRTTLHEYVGQVYTRFGVEGRPELMAYFLQRLPG